MTSDKFSTTMRWAALTSGQWCALLGAESRAAGRSAAPRRRRRRLALDQEARGKREENKPPRRMVAQLVITLMVMGGIAIWIA
jgi:hypothetical protein